MRHAVFGPHLEIRGSIALLTVRDNLRERIDLGSILSTVRAVSARPWNQSLTVQAKAILAVELNAVGESVLSKVRRAPGDWYMPPRDQPTPSRPLPPLLL